MPEFGDEIWKRAIHTLLRPMVEFLFPVLNREIDWSRGYNFLEQELANLFTPKKAGKGFVDVLAQVFLLDGSDRFILMHIEAQGYGSGELETRQFEERMFRYFYRVREKLKADIVSLAILTDSDENYRPDRYEYSLHGTSLTYVFNVCKIIDYDEEYLEQNTNPFATLMLSAKRALSVESSDDETKKKFKTGAARLMFKKGYSREDIEALYFFLDWVVSFSSREVKLECAKEIFEMANKEGAVMPYVTGIEEYLEMVIEEKHREKYKKQYMEQGMEKERAATVRRMLNRGMSVAQIADIFELSDEQVCRLAEECQALEKK